MKQQSGRRLAVLAVLWMATLAGCGSTEIATEDLATGQTEQGLTWCRENGYCPSGFTCVYGVCQRRCDTTHGVCTIPAGSTCCPPVFDDSTGVGSTSYCGFSCSE